MAAGIKNGAIFLNDSNYVAPHSSWLLGEYDSWFSSVIETLGLAYSTDMWDCDDFADLYSSLARICHRKTKGALIDHGLPVGIIHFQQANGGGHAVVAAFTSDKGLLFIEPQLRANVVPMTKENLSSAWLFKI